MDDDEEFLEYMDTQPLGFGKHRGETPEQIAKHDPSYVRWLYDTVTPKVCSKALVLAIEQNKRAGRRGSTGGFTLASGFAAEEDDDIPF